MSERLTAELSRGTGPEGADEVLLGMDGERHAVSVETALEFARDIQYRTGRIAIGCNYCGGLVAGVATEESVEAIVAAVHAHEETCPANPYRARIAELEADLARELGKPVVYAAPEEIARLVLPAEVVG